MFGHFAGPATHLRDDFRAVQLTQDACPLFAKLPAELRRVTWRECLGSQTVLLRRPFFSTHRQPKLGSVPLRRFNPGGDRMCHDRDLLALLRTCRAVHAEVIGVAYGSRDFYLWYGTSQPSLADNMHPSLAGMIRTFHLEVASPDPPSTGSGNVGAWEKMWADIAAMGSLRKLTVAVGIRFRYVDEEEERLYSWERPWAEGEARYLAACAQITHVPDFLLVLSWPAGDKPLPKLPCRIQRMPCTFPDAADREWVQLYMPMS